MSDRFNESQMSAKRVIKLLPISQSDQVFADNATYVNWQVPQFDISGINEDGSRIAPTSLRVIKRNSSEKT